jgi:expansin (peptidoglycan-binding protein)
MTLTIPASRYTAAAGPALFDGGRACGSYVQVTGARGTILVKIDNLCPECPANHLDLSNEAFAAIDDPAKGKVPISFREVRNPSVAGGLVLQVKDGSSQWWLGLHVDNAGNALSKVEVADGAAAFRPLTRQSWGWTQESNPGKGPFRVRVTDVYGQSVVVQGITLTPGTKQPTSSRLY